MAVLSSSNLTDAVRERYEREGRLHMFDENDPVYMADTGSIYPNEYMASTTLIPQREVYSRQAPKPEGRSCPYCGSYNNYDRIVDEGTCGKCGGPVRLSDDTERHAVGWKMAMVTSLQNNAWIDEQSRILDEQSTNYHDEDNEEAPEEEGFFDGLLRMVGFKR